jgi:hypothetical protein
VSAQRVRLLGDLARLLQVGEVSDDGLCALAYQISNGREPVAVASVDNDVVAPPRAGCARPLARTENDQLWPTETYWACAANATIMHLPAGKRRSDAG